MKRIFVALLTVLILSLTACGRSAYQKDELINNTLFNQFVIVKHDEYNTMTCDWHDFYIIYDKDTKVMYYLANGFNRAMMSPIYNSDGTVKIWDGK